MRYGQALPERLQKFADLLANKQANSLSKYDIPTVNGYELYDVYNVSIELPKYRLDNTRTLALQEQYVYSENKAEDFFGDIESDQIQEIQHELLKTLIKSSDKDKDLLKYFSTHTQTEPLILTHEGFVISGNRRLCALRELVQEDYDKYKHFTQVRVVILPNLDADKIDQIEDFLEQQTDIKEPFSWVSRALGYRRRMHKFNYSDEQLATITGAKKTTISGLINKLEIADRYLDSIDKPKDYNKILDDFYAFEKIYSCQTKDKGTPSKKAAFEKLAFLAIKNKENFSDRMYKNIPVIYEAQVLIEDELMNEFDSELQLIAEESKDIVGILGLPVNPDKMVCLIKLLNASENEEKIVEIVSDKIEEYQNLEREKKKKSSVLDRVRKANTLLVEANTIKNHEVDKSGILEQVSNIEKEIAKLKVWATE
jgi:ParB-like chromosome segregation protein Spo0J